jgi:hypothetical protein
VINLDTPLGQQLSNVAIREPITQIPADRDRDHLGRKPETSERRPGKTAPDAGESRASPTHPARSTIDRRNSAREPAASKPAGKAERHTVLPDRATDGGIRPAEAVDPKPLLFDSDRFTEADETRPYTGTWSDSPTVDEAVEFRSGPHGRSTMDGAWTSEPNPWDRSTEANCQHENWAVSADERPLIEIPSFIELVTDAAKGGFTELGIRAVTLAADAVVPGVGRVIEHTRIALQWTEVATNAVAGKGIDFKAVSERFGAHRRSRSRPSSPPR